MTTAIIDADVLCFYASIVNEGNPGIDWGAGVSEDELDEAEILANEKLGYWLECAGTDKYVLAFSGDSDKNFRRTIHPTYKDNRKDQEKPTSYVPLKERLEANHRSYSFENLEGDDVLGLIATAPKETWEGVEGDAIAVSTDKDIYTIPGNVCRIAHGDKPQEAPFYNNLVKANYFWMTQTLTGDPTDGYGGCPGVGPKRAEKVLKDKFGPILMWEAVVEEYRQKSNHPRWGNKFHSTPYAEALSNARAARILRWGDYDVDRQEVKLWTP